LNSLDPIETARMDLRDLYQISAKFCQTADGFSEAVEFGLKIVEFFFGDCVAVRVVRLILKDKLDCTLHLLFVHFRSPIPESNRKGVAILLPGLAHCKWAFPWQNGGLESGSAPDRLKEGSA
jgi:hypothetical protein